MHQQQSPFIVVCLKISIDNSIDTFQLTIILSIQNQIHCISLEWDDHISLEWDDHNIISLEWDDHISLEWDDHVIGSGMIIYHWIV